MLKKLLFLFLFLPSSLFARVAIPMDNMVYQYNDTSYILMYEGKTQRFLGAMTKIEFKKVVNAADGLVEEVTIEQNDRVRIIILNEVTLEEGKPFLAEMRIEWVTEKKEVIKFMHISQELTFKKVKQSLIFRYYKKVAIFGFPITLGLVIIFIFL